MSMIGTTLIKDICSGTRKGPSEILRYGYGTGQYPEIRISKMVQNTWWHDIIVCETIWKQSTGFAAAMRPWCLPKTVSSFYLREVIARGWRYTTKSQMFEGWLAAHQGILYNMFSDGLPDQFGGTMGQKVQDGPPEKYAGLTSTIDDGWTIHPRQNTFNLWKKIRQGMMSVHVNKI